MQILGADVGDDSWNFGDCLLRPRRSGEERHDVRLLLLRVGRVLAQVGRAALEPVGHEDLERVHRVRVRQDVGSLDRLWVEAEDVVDQEDGVFRAGWAGLVCF